MHEKISIITIWAKSTSSLIKHIYKKVSFFFGWSYSHSPVKSYSHRVLKIYMGLAWRGWHGLCANNSFPYFFSQTAHNHFKTLSSHPIYCCHGLPPSYSCFLLPNLTFLTIQWTYNWQRLWRQYFLEPKPQSGPFLYQSMRLFMRYNSYLKRKGYFILRF